MKKMGTKAMNTKAMNTKVMSIKGGMIKKFGVLLISLLFTLSYCFVIMAAEPFSDLKIDPVKGVVVEENGLTNIITKTYNIPSSRWEDRGNYWTFYYADNTQPCGRLEFAEDGTLLCYYDWEYIDGKWYAFDWNSIMMMGLVRDAGYNHTYYLDKGTGEMLTGEQVIMSECYVFDEVSGHLLCDCDDAFWERYTKAQE